MEKNPQLREALCLKFCAYYKPDKKEVLACRGYAVVERLTRAGRSLPFGVFDRTFDRAKAESVVKKMCTVCDFQTDGCDYMIDRKASPCGGLALLAQLVEADVITIHDVEGDAQ